MDFLFTLLIIFSGGYLLTYYALVANKYIVGTLVRIFTGYYSYYNSAKLMHLSLAWILLLTVILGVSVSLMQVSESML